MELRPFSRDCNDKDNRIFREGQKALMKNPIIELPAGVSPWKKIEVLESSWHALVQFFLAQVETFKTSYNTPGKDDWEEFFAENHPEEYKIYYAAKLAATRKV